MFWLVCLTTLTAMASLPLYRILGPIIRSKSSLFYTRLYTCHLMSQRSLTDVKKSQPQRIYTRTGDNGTSGLYTGERRPKDDRIFEALGTTDELNSTIGFAREFVNNKTVRDELEQIQCIIQDLQEAICTPKSSANIHQLRKTKWDRNHLVDLEAWMDNHSESLPPLKEFILPSGGKASSALHMARAICRRAERRVVPLLDEGLELPVLQYLNRLSSYLFTVARVCSRQDGFEETIYRRQRHYDDSEDSE